MSETSSAKSALTSAAEVLAAERLAILKQRQVRLGAEAGGAEEGQTDGGFVGLALSGGGIRSATFSLGVLQWLSSKLPNQKRRIIDFVDYLSTVSGGGYIGSWFLANRLRVAEKSQEQTAAATDTSFVNRADSPFVGYLRRFSHYLAPTSGLMSGDTWTMVAVWLRNTLLIQAMIFCAVALVMWVARLWLVGLHEMSGVKPLPGLGALFIVPILFGLSLAAWRSRRELSLFVEDDQTKVTENLKGGDPATQEKVQRRIVLPTILTSLVLTLAMWWRVEQNPQSMIEWLTGYKPTSIILDPAVILACLYMGAWAFRLVRVADDSKEPRGWLTHGLVFAGITLANLALLYVLEELFRVLHGIKPAGIEHLGMALAAVIGPALVSFCYSLIVILGIGLMGRRLRDKLREWWSRVYAWLMIYSVALLAVTSLAILGPLFCDWLAKLAGGWASGGVVSGWLATVVSSVLLGKSKDTSGKSGGMGVPLSVVTFAAFTGLLLAGAWLVRFMLTPEGGPSDPLLIANFDWIRWLVVAVMVFLVGAALVWKVDLNEFSMNHFYRNRLVRCYLGGAKPHQLRRPHPFTGFDFKDDIPLTHYAPAKDAPADQKAVYPGPYPLINTALNTAQGGDLDVQERMAESFLLSPLYCGYHRRRIEEREKPDGPVDPEPADAKAAAEKKEAAQGYRLTQYYMAGESEEGTLRTGIRLGTAVAISGAAASPNSGYHTSPVMAFLLTIFNARLGWWVPNPAKSLWVRIAPKGLGFFQYLCAELFGTATSQSEFVYLSDGGHFENLGIYELVRRRCRFIIAVDGEEDGLYAFHGLGTAIRRCRVDFDAEIDINVEDIRPTGAMGLSRCHCAVGRIKYPARGGLAESEGVLLYLKSSLTGDEGTDVQQYKAADPAFPHQSTGDQFFSESQFESYRTLGFHVAREAMEKLFHGGSLKNVSDGAFIDTVTKELKAHWYRPLRAPTETFVSHTQALDDLWADLAESGRPACLAELTLPNWESFVAGVAPSQRPVPAASFPEDPEEQRQVYAFCQRLIQLMENVYLDMNLRADGDHPDNSGWIALFRHWMGHPIVRRAWEHSQQTFGQRFGTFWKDLESAEAEKARLALPVKAAKRTNGAAKVNGGKKKAKPKPKDN